MQVHRNAKTTPKARAALIARLERDGWTVAQTAAAFHVSVRTVSKWRRRYRLGGVPALEDRSSRPQRHPRLVSGARVAAVRALRAQRLAGAGIAHRLGLPRSTVGAILRRCQLGRLPPLEPRPPVRRYEWSRAGFVHLDIKSFGRIAGVGHRIHGDWRHRPRGIGWEHAHVCIDDASRLAYVEVRPTLNEVDASACLRRAVAWFAARGVRVERVMTDNGAAYRARAFAATCAALGLRHVRTRPYRPQTNGKAERFVQTLMREWAYRRAYPTSAARRRALKPWLRYYNTRRPHTALRYRPPLTRLQELVAVNNVSGCNT